jgi:hypothetical protein
MISVQDIYLERQDLARKDHAGWISGEEFNRRLDMCQRILFEYYIQHLDENDSQGALQAFFKERALVRSSGLYLLPDDMEQILNVYTEDPACGDKTLILAPIQDRAEIMMHLTSPIRGFSLNKRHGSERLNDKLRIYPTTFAGRVNLKYYARPPAAFRAFTFNTTNNSEVYDAANSVNLQWGYTEKQNFVDLILLFDGVMMRDSELLQWASIRKQSEMIIND